MPFRCKKSKRESNPFSASCYVYTMDSSHLELCGVYSQHMAKALCNHQVHKLHVQTISQMWIGTIPPTPHFNHWAYEENTHSDIPNGTTSFIFCVCFRKTAALITVSWERSKWPIQFTFKRKTWHDQNERSIMQRLYQQAETSILKTDEGRHSPFQKAAPSQMWRSWGPYP